MIKSSSGTQGDVASCKSALSRPPPPPPPPVVYSIYRSKAVVPVLVLLFVALWFILRGDLFYVLSCVILFLYFSVLLALRLPRFWKRELILLLFVRLFVLCMFGFVGFLFLLVSGEGCGSTDRSKAVVPVLVLLFGALWFILQGDFLDGDIPRRTSYGVYISHFIRFARASSILMTLTTFIKPLLPNFLGRAIVILNFVRRFRKFIADTEKYSVSLKTLLQQGISEPEFYGDLVYRFRKIVGKSNFSEQFRKLIKRYKRIGYSLDIMRQTACLVVNPVIVNGYASLFNCTTAVRASDSMTVSS